MNPLLALTATLLVAPASATGLEAAVEAFEFGEHAAAAAGLRALLEPMQLTTDAEVARARRYLGASLYLLGEPQEARRQFSLLLATDPEHRLDPGLFSPPVVRFFELVRAEVAPAPRPSGGPALEPARSSPLPPAPPPLALAFVPFGVGQISNGRPLRGLVFGVLETGLFASAIGTLLAFEGLRVDEVDGNGDVVRSGFLPEDAARASALQTAFLVTLWTGVGVAAVGIVDALMDHPGVTTAPP